MKYLRHEKYGRIGYIRDDKAIITASKDIIQKLADAGSHIQLTIEDDE